MHSSYSGNNMGQTNYNPTLAKMPDCPLIEEKSISVLLSLLTKNSIQFELKHDIKSFLSSGHKFFCL